jgi:ribosomal protein S12 methylthiotransferase
MKSKRIGIVSLGCPRNLVDSQIILGRLEGKGHKIVDIQDADTAIINTCAFIEDAKRESIDVILDAVQLKKDGRLKKILVYGCLAQRYKAQLVKEFPEVDAFVGALTLNSGQSPYSLTPPHLAYLKICESCFRQCSFCVIPKIKGKFRSLDQQDVLKRVGDLNRQGISELNIIGQDITGYGVDLYKQKTLPQLLRMILAASANIPWIRLLYLYPDFKAVDSILDVMADNPRLLKYVDLPIQHCNQRILKVMRRAMSKKDIVRLIERIRKRLPAAAIRTSLIVGFPSETEAEFKELADFIREMRFERLGVFRYSREEQTPAYALKGQVLEKVKAARFSQLMALQQEVSTQVNRQYINKTITVLIEEKQDSGYIGRTEFDAPDVDGQVFITSGRPLSPGDIVQARITDTLEYDLVGSVV